MVAPEPLHPQRHETDGEEPLDPRLETVARRMRRLSLVSSGIMVLGVFAVFGVILYRTLSADTGYPPQIDPADVRQLVLTAEADATITNLVVDERSLFVTMQTTNGPVLVEIDRATWQIVSRAGPSAP